MRTVIGLFLDDENAQSSILKLEETGLAEDQISVLTQPQAVQNLLIGNQTRRVAPYIAWGTLCGMVILNVYGLTIGAYACSLCNHIPALFWICDVVGFTFLGLVLGAAAGWFVGLDKFEKEADLYTQGADAGGEVVTITVNNEFVTKVMGILRQENAVVVKTL
jgi:hypothetical protein